MLDIICKKCSKVHKISEENIGKKAKCSCGNTFIIKKKIKLKKLLIIMVLFMIIFSIIFYYINKKEYYYSNGKYIVNFGKGVDLFDIYDNNKKLLYHNVHRYYFSHKTNNYIVCFNGLYYRDNQQVEQDTYIWNRLTADCEIYDYNDKLLDSYNLSSPHEGLARHLIDKVNEY